ncbi:hypothetical protein [Burkholderia sp. Bp8998]|uniref:hypothetical protein n=1 Tax=Burkholderia sp. Bp8998 TaxID=2184557 RepID=UPI000F5B6453|nr:hypothetical protein [Burkholderia sp. Bp8998]RQS12163.1 hypothetical protein DIE06_26665 [Burkholderia sp. Bp8998]
MPIFIALFALIALGWGAVHLFHVIAAQFGQPRYTLSQLDGCEAAPIGGRWHLVVRVRDAVRGEWKLPMMDKRDAQRWARVLMLVKDNRL